MGAPAPVSGTQVIEVFRFWFHSLHQPVQTISGGGGGLGVAAGALVAGALVGAAIEDSRERHHLRRPHVDVVVRYKAQPPPLHYVEGQRGKLSLICPPGWRANQWLLVGETLQAFFLDQKFWNDHRTNQKSHHLDLKRFKFLKNKIRSFSNITYCVQNCQFSKFLSVI